MTYWLLLGRVLALICIFFDLLKPWSREIVLLWRRRNSLTDLDVNFGPMTLRVYGSGIREARGEHDSTRLPRLMDS